MEMIHDTLKIERIAGRTNAQTLVEGEITPPPDKPGMSEILDVQARIELGSVEALENRLMMDGSVVLFVLYTGSEGSIAGFDSVASFKHTVELPGIMPGMNVDATAALQTLDYSLLDERRLSARAVVDISCKVTHLSDVQTLSGITGINDVEVLSEELNIPQMLSMGSSTLMLREDVRLPQAYPFAQEVLHTSGNATVLSVRQEDSKAAVRGELQATVLYAGSDQNLPLQQVSFTLPFDQLVPMMGSTYSDLEARVKVQEITATPVEDDSVALMNIEASIKLDILASHSQEAFALLDAYSPTVPIACDTSELELRLPICSANTRTNISEVLPLPQGNPPVSRILYVSARPVVTGCKAQKNTAEVEGTIFAKAVYMCSAGQLHNAAGELPFSFTMDMPAADEDSDIELSVSCENASASGSGNMIDIRTALQAQSRAYRLQHIRLAAGIHESEKQPAISGIVVYFASAGETLWDIAKRFNTTRSEILKLNANLPETIPTEGQKLLLYLKKAV